jgi:hypothetical protein
MDTFDLDTVRRRRAELLESLKLVEEALAAAAIGRSAVWGERVNGAVDQLARDFAVHIDVTEGPDGLHQTILSGDLRLANAVQALTNEHAVIRGAIADLCTATGAAVAGTDVSEIREQANLLMGRIIRHRQRGADLVYEAFHTDIGGYG